MSIIQQALSSSNPEDDMHCGLAGFHIPPELVCMWVTQVSLVLAIFACSQSPIKQILLGLAFAYKVPMSLRALRQVSAGWQVQFLPAIADMMHHLQGTKAFDIVIEKKGLACESHGWHWALRDVDLLPKSLLAKCVCQSTCKSSGAGCRSIPKGRPSIQHLSCTHLLARHLLSSQLKGS